MADIFSTRRWNVHLLSARCAAKRPKAAWESLERRYRWIDHPPGRFSKRWQAIVSLTAPKQSHHTFFDKAA